MKFFVLNLSIITTSILFGCGDSEEGSNSINQKEELPLNYSGLNIENDVENPWLPTSESIDGLGLEVLSNKSTSLIARFDVGNKEKLLSFNWKLASEIDRDLYKGYQFYIDDHLAVGMNSDEWTKEEFELTAGSHTLEWRFHGEYSAYLDKVDITPLPDLDNTFAYFTINEVKNTVYTPFFQSQGYETVLGDSYISFSADEKFYLNFILPYDVSLSNLAIDPSGASPIWLSTPDCDGWDENSNLITSGSLNIYELKMDMTIDYDYKLDSFAANYNIICDGVVYKGAVRYNTDVPLEYKDDNENGINDFEE
ncbi:MAG: hypothetical protein HRT54_18330 [Colwellia sp.]|nr:hypothetical protein [Colwellia sp.]